MTDRFYFYDPVSPEEEVVFKVIDEYVKDGNIQDSREYHDKECFIHVYSNNENHFARLAKLRKNIKNEYRPPYTYDNFIKPNTYRISFPLSQKESFIKCCEEIIESIKDRKKNRLIELFNVHHNAIWTILNQELKEYLEKYEECNGIDFEYEILAFMMAFTVACVENKKKAPEFRMYMNNLVDDNYGWYRLCGNWLNDRSELYSSIMKKNIARAEWLMGNTSDNPLINAYIALGDFLYNPECAKDYDNAPVLIDDIFSASTFAMTMKKVQAVVFNYMKNLKRI